MNMAGMKYGLRIPHPHPDILKRYKELGGEIVTIGADAHCPEHIAYDFRKAGAILKACRFEYYTEFKERIRFLNMFHKNIFHYLNFCSCFSTMSLVDESLTKFRGLLKICNKDREDGQQFLKLQEELIMAVKVA